MSDFMKWLYDNYIKPHMNTPAQGSDYALRRELLESQLEEHGLEDLEKALEFQAVQAFLLGFRTGKGLADSSTP